MDTVFQRGSAIGLLSALATVACAADGGAGKPLPPFLPAAEVAPPSDGDATLAQKIVKTIEKEYLAPWPQDLPFLAEFTLLGPDGKPIDTLHVDWVNVPLPAAEELRPRTDFPDRDAASELACAWLRLAVATPLESVHEANRDRSFRAWTREDGYVLMEGAKGKYFDRVFVSKDHEIRRREGWTRKPDRPSPIIIHEYETETKEKMKTIRRVVERHLDEKTGELILERSARFAYERTFEKKPFVSSIAFTFAGKELTVRTERVE